MFIFLVWLQSYKLVKCKMLFSLVPLYFGKIFSKAVG